MKKVTTVRRQLKCKASQIRRSSEKEQIKNFLKYDEEPSNERENVPWEVIGRHHTQYRKNAG